MGMGSFTAPALAGVVGVYGFFPETGGKLFQCGRLRAAKKDFCVHIADNCVAIILVYGF